VVALTAKRPTTLQSAAPAEFDGPGNRWSPETLLVGAVPDCFILTLSAEAARWHIDRDFAFGEHLDYAPKGERVVCRTTVLYGSPPRKQKTPVATPTTDRSGTISGVLNGELWAK
jgi:hypothetical protein